MLIEIIMWYLQVKTNKRYAGSSKWTVQVYVPYFHSLPSMHNLLRGILQPFYIGYELMILSF